MTKTALILFAHGARDPEWAATLRRVAAAARTQDSTLRIELAFLELQTPTLADSAEVLIGEAFDRIVVVPMFMAQGSHLKHDLPRAVEELRAAHPDVRFEVVPAIGEAESVVQAMAKHVLRLSSAQRSND